MELSFPKNEKLKSKKVFEQLFKEGRQLKKYPLKLIYLNVAHEEPVKVKVAVVAPKRSFKSAVTRNRIKRLLRESYRLNKPLIFNNIEGKFAFVFLYLGKEEPHFKDVEEKMRVLLELFLKKQSYGQVR
ncbi:MAG: ribonuclease P protein component [Bacteroidota bacterium]